MKNRKNQRKHRLRTWGLMIVLALAIISVLQQPAGSPPADPPPDGADAQVGEEGSPDAGRTRGGPSEILAEEAGALIARRYPVTSVEIAVKHDTALIAVIPEAGLSPDEHRRLERTIADETAIAGVRDVIVTTDPAMHDGLRRLALTRRDVERRVGDRMTESNISWAKAFDELATQIQNLGSHARKRHSAAAAGSLGDP